jgi:hypothetical protein
VIIFYPPDHPYSDSMAVIARGYIRALSTISETMNMSVPTDTLVVAFYPDFETGRQMTGRYYPFAERELIHFWYPSFYGTTFMQWFLPRWSPAGTTHRFLRHGMISLFDHSGQNYHAATLRYYDAGEYYDLYHLSIDTTIDSDTERLQSAEAASFCAFFIAWYGVDRFKSMYESQTPFDRFVTDSLGLTVDSLQQMWLNVIRANVPADSVNVP